VAVFLLYRRSLSVQEVATMATHYLLRFGLA
jgi:hypothetical protein